MPDLRECNTACESFQLHSIYPSRVVDYMPFGTATWPFEMPCTSQLFWVIAVHCNTLLLDRDSISGVPLPAFANFKDAEQFSLVGRVILGQSFRDSIDSEMSYEALGQA
jgi:hypothetical protein